MKIQTLPLASLALALASVPALAANVGVNGNTSVGVSSGQTDTNATAAGTLNGNASNPNGNVSGTGVLGIDISKAGTDVQSQQAFYAGLSATQKARIKAACGIDGTGTSGTSSTGHSADLSAQELVFCNSIVH